MTTMNTNPPKTRMFVDDGYPESREYEDNYVVIERTCPEPWVHLPEKSLFGRPEPKPRGATRLHGTPAA